MSDTQDNIHPMHLVLFLVGGMCTGAGLLNLYWSFGVEGGELNRNFARIGASGMDDIGFLDRADIAIPLIVVGVAALVIANASAWKETDGY